MQEFDTVWQYVQNDGLYEEIKNNMSNGDKVNDLAKQSPEFYMQKNGPQMSCIPLSSLCINNRFLKVAR